MPRPPARGASLSMEEAMVKAAVMYNFNEPLKVESVTLKAPREDEVVVKVVASGVCHTDLSVIQAKLPMPPPVVLGHEGAGIVEEVGKAVTNVRPGDHVVLSWVENCGKCHYCASGRLHLCDANIRPARAGQESVWEKDGVDIMRMAGVGSFAERTIVRATAAIKIADDIPLDKACLVGCGVMTGVGAAINTVKVRPGATVAVIGAPAVITQAFLSVKRGGTAVVVGVPAMGQDVTVPGLMLPLEEKSLI